MTGEQMYSHVCQMVLAYTGKEDHDVLRHPDLYLRPRDCADPFLRGAAAFILDARDMMDTRHTERSVIAAVKRIIKNAKDGRTSGIFEHAGRFVVCDGHHMVRLNKDITSLPHCESSFDTDTPVRGCCTTKGLLELPSIRAVKEHMEWSKAAYKGRPKNYKPRPYPLGDSVYVAPEYLLDMLQALPHCVAYKPEHPLSGIYFKAYGGDGVLCPVNIKKWKSGDAT